MIYRLYLYARRASALAVVMLFAAGGGRAVILHIDEPPASRPIPELKAVLDMGRVKQGGFVVLTVTGFEGRAAATARALGLDLKLYPVPGASGVSSVGGAGQAPVLPAPGVLRTLIPVPLATKPGRHLVRVAVGRREARVYLTVVKRPARKLRRLMGLIVTPEKAEALRTDKGRLGKILGMETRQAYWSGPVRRPVPAPVTAEFGVPRSYGGGAGWVHKGVDMPMPRNWPVMAPAGGVVRMARLMGAYGNIIVLDHGQGIFTAYLHLRTIMVETDARVDTGQVIGTVGATGMASGPHLHFGVYMHRVAVDPVEFLERGLP